MDYVKHYTRLIERAKIRSLKDYGEYHHIKPKCLGGDDNTNNIVYLTPEEHFIAHQLLVKMHPEHQGLLWAALQMTRHRNGCRSTNKLYGWLRRRYSTVAKQRTGERNGSFGRPWYYNPETGEAGKFIPGTEPHEWIRGRCKGGSKCKACGESTGKQKRKWCDDCNRIHNLQHHKGNKKDFSNLEPPFKQLIAEGHSFTEAIYRLGYKNWNLKDGVGKWMKQVYNSM